MDLVSVAHLLNGLLMIVLPIALGIFLIEKFRLGWKIWLIGGSTFIISQILHLPFNIYLLNPSLVKLQQSLAGFTGSLVVAVLLGLSAGIFEECARYAMYRWWLKDSRSWRVGILAGAGHGGVEAIILGILVMVTYINMVVYRGLDLSRLNLTPEQHALAIQQIQSYWNLPWYTILMGALERAFTIPLHIFASVLVVQVFTRRPGHQQLAWLGLAILYHAFMDASALLAAAQWGIYIVEALLGVMAILDIALVFALRQPEPQLPAPVPVATPGEPPTFTPTPIEETSENLEQTRYQ